LPAPERALPEARSGPSAPTPAELGWELQLAALIGTGPTPRPALGGALGVGLDWRRLHVELQAEYWGSRRIAYAEAPEVELRFDLFGLNLRGCYVMRWEHVQLPLCLGVEPGLLHGSARGVDQTQAAQRLWLALSASTPLRVRLGSRVWLWLELGLGWGLIRPSFGVRNLPALYAPPRLNVRSGLGIALNFN
jgi:hypothetical protein